MGCLTALICWRGGRREKEIYVQRDLSLGTSIIYSMYLYCKKRLSDLRELSLFEVFIYT